MYIYVYIEVIWPANAKASAWQVVITLLDAGVAAVPGREQPPPLCLAAQKGHHQARTGAIKLWVDVGRGVSVQFYSDAILFL